MKKQNLWILTEERPKRDVTAKLLHKFARDQRLACFIDTIRILPILQDDRFAFLYEVVGFRSNAIDKVFMKSISGYSSFVDFLIFFQDDEPTHDDIPLYAIEETKTDDSESRNTGVYQRASKFVYLEYFYKDVRKVMFYNLRIAQKIDPTQTSIFGTRMLKTIDVEIEGKELDSAIFKPFETLEELIEYKNRMRQPPKGNIPINITKEEDIITVTGRLFKSGGLAHDPNIGALSLICSAIRKLGWEGRLIISEHGLNQRHLTPRNKFVKIANMLGIELDGLSVPASANSQKYWKYETEGEKLGTIFIHLVVENFTDGDSIFENHAGCEKGYFITSKGLPIALEKYLDREAYKNGDTSQIIYIPDLILIDFGRSEIINIEGKRYQLRSNGIAELGNFNGIENGLIKKFYPDYKIIRTVVLYGGTETKIIEIEIGFLLNKNGDLVLGIKAPELFKDAINNLLDFWINNAGLS